MNEPIGPKERKMRILIAALLILAITAPAWPGSLWTETSGSLFSDRKARRTGDVVTVLIVEKSSASQEATTDVTKKSKVAVDGGFGFLLKNIPAMGFGGSTGSNASGSTSRSANLAARISAVVTAVLPDGNLVIEGSRSVKANDECQIIRISGIVRPEDIAPDNTVLSTFLADAKIEYTGKGPIAERQKPGIVTRIFRILF